MAVVSGGGQNVFTFCSARLSGTSHKGSVRVQAPRFWHRSVFCSAAKSDSLIEWVEAVISIAEKTDKRHSGQAAFHLPSSILEVREVWKCACDNQISAYVGHHRRMLTAESNFRSGEICKPGSQGRLTTASGRFRIGQLNSSQMLIVSIYIAFARDNWSIGSEVDYR